MKHKHGEDERDDRVKQDSTLMREKGCRESNDKEHIGDQAFRAFTHLGALSLDVLFTVTTSVCNHLRSSEIEKT
jgi:hypothetical protein